MSVYIVSPLARKLCITAARRIQPKRLKAVTGVIGLPASNQVLILAIFVFRFLGTSSPYCILILKLSLDYVLHVIPSSNVQNGRLDKSLSPSDHSNTDITFGVTISLPSLLVHLS